MASSSSSLLHNTNKGINNNNNHHHQTKSKTNVNVNEDLLIQLDTAVQKCVTRYLNRYELATEQEPLVADLCLCLERIFCHGLRHKPRNLSTSSSSQSTFLNKTEKLFNGVLPSSSVISPSSSSSSSSSSSKNGNKSGSEVEVTFWWFVCHYLSEHESRRFIALRNVATDAGRGRSWIRNSLNEHSLEKYLATLLEDRYGYRRQYYHDWALILCASYQDDGQLGQRLLNTISQLATVLFALNIDHAQLDVPTAASVGGEEANCNKSESPELAPVVVERNLADDTIAEMKKKRAQKKKIRNIITINEDSFNTASGDDDEFTADISGKAVMMATSAPVGQSYMHFASNCGSEIDSSDPTTSNTTSTVPNIYEPALEVKTPAGTGKSLMLPSAKSSSSLSISDQSRDNLVLFPIGNSDSPRSGTMSSSPVQNLLEKIDSLEAEKKVIQRENNLLHIQLKKYIAAIELLKYNKPLATTGGGNIENSITEQNFGTNEQGETQEQQKQAKTDGDAYSAQYEKKLIQVSEMHGELVEFNEHLYRVIQQKESIINRLRDELIELRGPLPDNVDELSLSISSEGGDTVHSVLQSVTLPQPLVHAWIPTAFLSGGFKGSKSHHIYQIYVRIKEEEWNVYRRYSQFYQLHKRLKEKYGTPIGQLEFPPKKAIGNKDSRVVQERRKKLECYLRNVINYIQTQPSVELTNKERLIGALPFLSDKFYLQDHRMSHSDTNLASSMVNLSGCNTVGDSTGVGGGSTQSQQSTSASFPQQPTQQNYMGF